MAKHLFYRVRERLLLKGSIDYTHKRNLKYVNATQAAIRAGYKPNDADKIRHELLGKTLVSQALQQMKKQLLVSENLSKLDIQEAIQEKRKALGC